MHVLVESCGWCRFVEELREACLCELQGASFLSQTRVQNLRLQQEPVLPDSARFCEARYNNAFSGLSAAPRSPKCILSERAVRGQTFS